VQEAARTLARRLRGRGAAAGAGRWPGWPSRGGSRPAAGRCPRRDRQAGPTADWIDSPGYLKHYADERVPIGLWLGRHARPDDLASVGGAGVIPYYSGLRAFDCYGLVDETIAHDPP
jgi:hypothetical protein